MILIKITDGCFFFIPLALDPAKPWFDVTAETNTISKDDAQLVDVIHTNSGFLLNVR